MAVNVCYLCNNASNRRSVKRALQIAVGDIDLRKLYKINVGSIFKSGEDSVVNENFLFKAKLQS